MSKKMFISFAIHDKTTHDLFMGQAKHDKVPYEFSEMLQKQPWDENWKNQARAKIKNSDLVLVLITKGLKTGNGAMWEIRCAKEEKKPILGLFMHGTTIEDSPDELHEAKKANWSWSAIEEFLNE